MTPGRFKSDPEMLCIYVQTYVHGAKRSFLKQGVR